MSKTIWLVAAAIVGALAIVKMLAKPSADERSIARQKVKDGACIVDVRTVGEYASGHFDNALNIPLQELQDRLGELGGKSRPVVVYCAAGARAARAKSILLNAGFTDVTNAGGLADISK